MNRIQRRQERKQQEKKQTVAPSFDNFAATHIAMNDLMGRANAHLKRGELSTAAHLYRKILSIRPDHGPALERLAEVHLMQGKPEKASAEYAELAHVMPQTLTQFDKVLDTLKRLVPELADELTSTTSAPSRDLAS